MATLVLGAVGSAIGAGFGGTILGFSGAAIGGFIGSTLGTVADRYITAALTPNTLTTNTSARLVEMALMSSAEGSTIARTYGRARLSTQLIWATQFKETENIESQRSGGKGGGGETTTTSIAYTYSISFAVAICEGNAKAQIGRVWLNGNETDLSTFTFRFYPGSQTQTPDPLIQATEGLDFTPAYRGTSYLVFESMPLEDYGNRIPQVTVEVVVPLETDDPDDLLNIGKSFQIIPSAGEVIYGTQVYTDVANSDEAKTQNRHNNFNRPDAPVAIDQLNTFMTDLDAVAVVVAWFGTDLRADQCRIIPKIENSNRVISPTEWSVAGYTRATTEEVSLLDGKPVFGGTPSDATVLEIVAYLTGLGKRVVFYPFILMDIPSANTLPNPYSNNAAGVGQAVLPWRGRITCSPAIGYTGTVDQTATAATQINNWFTKTEGYRAMVLHYANLLDTAGLDAFIIGSELVGITSVRSNTADAFPGVAQLVTLAADVSPILGAGVKVGYAADWSEYHSYRPVASPNEVRFNMDPLWSSADIDFIGIDNYLPMSDWRDGMTHLDFDETNGPTSEYDMTYLKSNIEGHEFFDWYYASSADRDAQIRTPITDGAYADPFVFRQKDIRNWWLSGHHNRTATGLRTNLSANAPTPTAWVATGTGATITAFAGTFLGRYANAARIQSGANINGRGMATGVVVTGPTDVLQMTVFLTAGTNTTARIIAESIGTYVTVNLSAGTISGVVPGVNTIANERIVDLGGGNYMVQFDVSGFAASTSVRLGVSSVSTTLNVIVYGADVVRKNVSTTTWVPQSKPVWFTEFGCPAVNRGTNQPNVFYDPKSSESFYPYNSNGQRDDFIQRQYLEGTLQYWRDNAPTSTVYGDKMVKAENMFIWTWDARPFPAYPAQTEVWSDGALWEKGHWLSGRIDGAVLQRFVAKTCERVGLLPSQYDVSRLDVAGGLIRGFYISNATTEREILETLARFCQFTAVESEGKIKFIGLANVKRTAVLDLDDLVLPDGQTYPVSLTRKQEIDLASRAELTFVDELDDFNSASVSAEKGTGTSQDVMSSSFPIVSNVSYMRALALSMVFQQWQSRESGGLSLPPSYSFVEAGDALDIPVGTNRSLNGRVLQIDTTKFHTLEFEGFDTSLFNLVSTGADIKLPKAGAVYQSSKLTFLDIPLVSSAETYQHAPRVATWARPWPGTVNLYREDGAGGHTLIQQMTKRATMGETQTPLFPGPIGVWDMANTVDVYLYQDGLVSQSKEQLLASNGNAIAIYNEPDNLWEVFQFTTAQLLSPGVYRLSGLLRGGLGTEDAVAGGPHPSGSRIVVLNTTSVLELRVSAEIAPLTVGYRWGPSTYPATDPTYLSGVHAGTKRGLRPYSPTDPKLVRNSATSDLTLSWVRRTRVNGDGWEQTEVPLNEETEQYRVVVLTGPAGTVKRTAVTTVPTWVYTLADQTTDFGSAQTQVYVQISQYGGAYGNYGGVLESHVYMGSST